MSAAVCYTAVMAAHNKTHTKPSTAAEILVAKARMEGSHSSSDRIWDFIGRLESIFERADGLEADSEDGGESDFTEEDSDEVL